MSHGATHAEGPGLAAAVPAVAPGDEAGVEPVRLSQAQVLESWEQLIRQMALLLRQAEPDAAWLGQFTAATAAMRTLARGDPDAALYLLLQAAAAGVERYSACHAMLCALVCELCAGGFKWPADEIDALVRAALTMNLSMSEMQDALARQAAPLSDAQRAQIDSHPERSAALLEGAGVTDALWLAVVRLHRDDGVCGADPEPSPARRSAELLRRVDVYTAKLSSRAGREQRSPAIAARDSCIGSNGVPDRIGAAILRTLGLYPPGCFVQLANGDFGVVVKRGGKAHTPWVAALRRQDGAMYMPPTRRDTARRGYAVAHGVTRGAVKIRCDHKRNLDAS